METRTGNLVKTAGLTLSLKKSELIVDTDVTLDVTNDGTEGTGVGVEELNTDLKESRKIVNASKFNAMTNESHPHWPPQIPLSR